MDIFSIKFPKVPNVFRGQVLPPDETGTKHSQWNFQGFRNKHGEPVDRIVKNRSQSLADLFIGQRYRHVDEGIPLDTMSTNSDHIYAEIEDEPPTVPPRADTPTVAPKYPPYSSVRAKKRNDFVHAYNW